MRYTLIIPIIFTSFVLPSYGEVSSSYELNIAKGTERFNRGNYDEASIYFEDALRAAPGDIKATLFLGIVRGRQERYNEAEGLIKKVLESGKELPRAHYELAYIAHKRGYYHEARENLKRARDLSKDPNLNMMIDSLLDDIEFRSPSKRFGIAAIMGIQYDNNVIYIPDTVEVEREEKEDIRGVLSGNFHWMPISTATNKTALGYSIYQSLHLDLSEYDIQSHEVSAVTDFNPSRGLSLQGRYSFNYTFLGGDRYSMIHLLSPSIIIDWKEKLSTRLFYEYRSKTYWDTEVSVDSENRKAQNNLIGIVQNIIFSRNFGTEILYSYDMNNARTDYWTYNGNRITGSLYFTYQKWRLDMLAEYYDKKFKGLYPESEVKRHDRTESYTTSLTHSFTSKFLVSLNYSFINNSSNLDLYAYDRSIAGLFLIGMF